MTHRTKTLFRTKWPLMTAVALFGASLGLLLSVALIPVGKKATTQILITDGSAATEEIVEAVLTSNMYQAVYKRKAPEELKFAEIDVHQKGVGPLFEISTVAAQEYDARRAIWMTASILDANSQKYFGAYSDLKVLSSPNVSPFPSTWSYIGYSGAGLGVGFLLGVAISWALTKVNKNGSLSSSEEGPETPEIEPQTPFEVTSMPILEDMPWIPEAETDDKEGDEEEEKESSDVPKKHPEEQPKETPELEPVEPFSEPVHAEKAEEAADEDGTLEYGELPSTEPISDEDPDINTMFEHLPQA